MIGVPTLWVSELVNSCFGSRQLHRSEFILILSERDYSEGEDGEYCGYQCDD
jgi:hypothetical protein